MHSSILKASGLGARDPELYALDRRVSPPAIPFVLSFTATPPVERDAARANDTVCPNDRLNFGVLEAGLYFVRDRECLCRASDKENRMRIRRLIKPSSLSKAPGEQLRHASVRQWLGIERSPKIRLGNL